MCGVAFGQDVGTGRGGRGAGAQKGRCINRGEPNGSFRWGGGSGLGRADVQAGCRAPCVDSITCPWSRADAHLVEVIGEPVAQGGRRATRRGLAHLTTADSSLLLNLECEPPTDAPRAVPRRRSRPVERGVCGRRGCRCARAPFVASGNVRSCPGPLSGSLGGFGIFPLCSSVIEPTAKYRQTSECYLDLARHFRHAPWSPRGPDPRPTTLRRSPTSPMTLSSAYSRCCVRMSSAPAFERARRGDA